MNNSLIQNIINVHYPVYSLDYKESISQRYKNYIGREDNALHSFYPMDKPILKVLTFIENEEERILDNGFGKKANCPSSGKTQVKGFVLETSTIGKKLRNLEEPSEKPYSNDLKTEKNLCL